MVDIGKIQIRKKIYKFDIRGKYQYVDHYKVIQRPPLEQLKDALKQLFAPKKEEKKVEAKLAAAPPPGGFNFGVLGAAILIALIILGLGWLYVTTQILPQAAAFQPPVEKLQIDNTLLGGTILSSGEIGAVAYTAGVFLDYQTGNLDNYSVTLTPYETRIPSEVYVLNSEKIEASTYADFVRELRSNLGTRNIVLNEISIKQLETIPQGAIIIVPSGVVPQEMLGVDSLLTMTKLVDRGIVVIYIGQPFTKMLDGTLAVSTPQDILKGLPVSFDENNPPASASDFSLFQPLYRAVGKADWTTTLAYGSVSITKKGNGAFIFLPQTLDGGWRGDYEAAADDVSRIVFEIPWTEPVGQPHSYVFTEQSNYSGTEYLFTEPFGETAATIKMDFMGQSSASKNPVQETQYIYVEKPVENELLVDGGVTVVPTNLTNDLIRMNALLDEDEPGQPNMYLIFFNASGDEVQRFPQGTVNVQADRSFDIPVYVDRGEYMVKLIDDESNVYAQTYLDVVSIDIIYQGFSTQQQWIYYFDVKMGDEPEKLSDVTVTVNGGQYGTYNFKDVSTIAIDFYGYTGGENLPDGSYTFEFVSGDLRLVVPVEIESAQTIFTNPVFWLTLILTVGVVGLGVFFARQEQVYFSLDVPDFPPVSRTRVPLSPDVVLSLFNKVNENYRWEHTPLTIAEIKNAFRDIFYKGRPIYITDYNVEFLLEQLRKKDAVGESLEYYGLTTWEEKTKHTIDYLALMRRLRDICVNNAVPFTGLDESKEADSVITVVGQQMFLHFFEKETDLKKLVGNMLSTIGEGITIIVFHNEHDKEEFLDLVNSSPTVAPLIVKMEAHSKSLLLYTADELEQMIKEFKSM